MTDQFETITLHDHFDERMTLRVAQPQPQYGTVQLNTEYKGQMLSVDVNVEALREALLSVAASPVPEGKIEVEVRVFGALANGLGTAERIVIYKPVKLNSIIAAVTQASKDLTARATNRIRHDGEKS